MARAAQGGPLRRGGSRRAAASPRAAAATRLVLRPKSEGGTGIKGRSDAVMVGGQLPAAHEVQCVVCQGTAAED